MSNIVDLKISDELIIINAPYKGIADDEVNNVASFNLKTKELITAGIDKETFEDLSPRLWKKHKNNINFLPAFNTKSFNPEAAATLMWHWWNENIHQLVTINVFSQQRTQPELNITFKDYEDIPLEKQHEFGYLVYRFLHIKKLRINGNEIYWNKKDGFPNKLLTGMNATFILGLYILLATPIFKLIHFVTSFELTALLEIAIFMLLGILFSFTFALIGSFVAAFLWTLISKPFFSNEILGFALEYQGSQPRKHPIGKIEKSIVLRVTNFNNS